MQHIYIIHGWGGTKKSLQPLSEELLKKGYIPVLLEMPGHGETEQMTEPWDMADFTEWLKSKIEEKDVKNYSLIGHSFGGKIILESIISGKLNPNKAVLIDISGIKPQNSLKKLFWKTASIFVKPVRNLPIIKQSRKLVYYYIIGERDYYKAEGSLKPTFELINKTFYDGKLGKVKTDTLLIWGKQDAITPLWMGVKLNKGIKNSQMVVLEGKHSLPLEKPEEVSKYITDFLK